MPKSFAQIVELPQRLLTLLCLAFLLTACVAAPTAAPAPTLAPAPTQTPAPPPTATPTPTTTAAPTATATPEPTNTPTAIPTPTTQPTPTTPEQFDQISAHLTFVDGLEPATLSLAEQAQVVNQYRQLEAEHGFSPQQGFGLAIAKNLESGRLEFYFTNPYSSQTKRMVKLYIDFEGVAHDPTQETWLKKVDRHVLALSSQGLDLVIHPNYQSLAPNYAPRARYLPDPKTGAYRWQLVHDAPTMEKWFHWDNFTEADALHLQRLITQLVELSTSDPAVERLFELYRLPTGWDLILHSPAILMTATTNPDYSFRTYPGGTYVNINYNGVGTRDDWEVMGGLIDELYLQHYLNAVSVKIAGPKSNELAIKFLALRGYDHPY